MVADFLKNYFLYNNVIDFFLKNIAGWERKQYCTKGHTFDSIMCNGEIYIVTKMGLWEFGTCFCNFQGFLT